MFNIEDLFGEFDDTNRIVHLTAKKPVHATTLEEGKILSEAVQKILDKYLIPDRGYMVTDYSKIILEPIYIEVYSREIKKIIDKYLYPNGLARYGFEVSRITARISHDEHLGGTPNLFKTKKEAYNYIYNQIEKRKPKKMDEDDSHDKTPNSDEPLPVMHDPHSKK